jgi:hypothetical protein
MFPAVPEDETTRPLDVLVDDAARKPELLRCSPQTIQEARLSRYLSRDICGHVNIPDILSSINRASLGAPVSVARKKGGCGIFVDGEQCTRVEAT